MNSNLTSRSEHESAATTVRRSITRMARLLGHGMPRNELTPIRLAALNTLRIDGPMNAGTLATRLGILLPSLTRMVSNLEAANLVTRNRDPGDRREVVLKITTKARSLIRDEGVRRDALLRETMERVISPAEIAKLQVAASILEKLANRWSCAIPAAPESRVDDAT
jgi:DNA-binding MarR family transcriptional regulator